MRKIIDSFDYLNKRIKLVIIFILLLIPRITYIFYNKNVTADSEFYLEVAENIRKGCGFAFTNNLGECQALTGGYFPAYPYLIWFLESLGLDYKLIPVFISIFTLISIIYLLLTLFKIRLAESKIYYLAIFLGLSPVGFGYSRYLLIEPVIYIFSIILLAEFINLKINPENFKHIFLRVSLVAVISVFFKPTSIILIIPHFLIILVNNGINKFIKSCLIFSLIISLSIIPWTLRGIRLGNNPFQSDSNNAPVNIRGLRSWLSTFSLTEYDHASTLFPIYDRKDGDRKKISINTKWNPFISENDADFKKVEEILFKDNPSIKRGFTKDEDKLFDELAKERLKNNGFLGNSTLFIIKTSSLLLNPINSWGWPISIGLDAKFSLFNGLLLTKISFKLFIFVYRIILFYIYFKYIFLFFKSFNPINFLSKNNYNLIQDEVILIGSFLMLIGYIIMHIGYFQLVEHRYIYPIIPWIEFSVYFKLMNNYSLKFLN